MSTAMTKINSPNTASKEIFHFVWPVKAIKNLNWQIVPSFSLNFKFYFFFFCKFNVLLEKKRTQMAPNSVQQSSKFKANCPHNGPAQMFAKKDQHECPRGYGKPTA